MTGTRVGTPERMRDDAVAFQRFAEDLMEWATNDPERYFGSEWSEDFNPTMQQHGLLVYEAYDPAKHGEGDEMDEFTPGDMVWWFTDRAYRAAKRSRDRQARP